MDKNNLPNKADRRFQSNKEPKEFEEKVIQVNRVSKKTKGGNRINFSVLMVVGDRQGQVGVGHGKSASVLSSIEKGIKRAKKRLIQVPIKNGTIPFPITIKKGAARLLLKPAPVGTGVIAGGAVRAVVEAAGIQNIVSKTIGGSNQASNVYATFAALKQIKQIAELKGLKLEKPQLVKVMSKSSPRINPKLINSFDKTQSTKIAIKPNKPTFKPATPNK